MISFCVVALEAKLMLRLLAVRVSHHRRQRNGAAMAAATVELVRTASGETLHLRGDRLDLLWEADGQLVLREPSGVGGRVAGGTLLELAPTAQRQVDEPGSVRCMPVGPASEPERVTDAQGAGLR